MVQPSKKALGQVVRGLRERKGMTQEELGREAGYRTGAGVSISRLESGLLRPAPRGSRALPRHWGSHPRSWRPEPSSRRRRTTAAVALRLQGRPAARRVGRQTVPRPRLDRGNSTLGKKGIEQEIEERTKVITDLSEAFNKQHDRARDEFFMRFVEIAERVEGAPQPEPTQLQDDDATDADAVAAYRLESYANGVVQALAVGAGGAAAGAAVGSAAAYGTFVAAASFGTASTGAAISGLSGIAATNATLALLGGGTLAAGGAGVAGGTIVLAGIVAAPAVILFAGGLAWMAKRNRKQRQEFAAQLDEAEARLAATRPGIEALQNTLPRAAETLDYIATHAGHALNRWEDQLGSGSMTWDSLGQTGQRRYQDFIEIAAAQVMIVTLNFPGLLITRGSDQDELIQLADEVLTQSEDVVKARV